MAFAVKRLFKPQFNPAKLLYPKSFYTYVNEPTMIIKGKEPTCVKCAEDAFKDLESGMTVFIQGAAATPTLLVKAMTQVGMKQSLKNISVCHMHTEGEASYAAKECEGIFRGGSFFMAGNVRKAVAEGRQDAMSIFLSEIPLLFKRKLIVPDICLIQVSPPDQHGFCSLGSSVDCVRAALENCCMIIAQVNPNTPRTFGDSTIHYSHIDYAFPCDVPLVEHPSKPPSKEETIIGKLIADNLVQDGATLQMGIGSLPDAVLSALKNHKDLGIHTEMFSTGVIDLIELGCITNNRKKRHQGRMVSSFFLGAKELYKYFDNNPFLEMLAIDYVNKLETIAQQNHMVAINSCIEVDLTGQVSADSIGTRMYSGFGGQVDFIRGAAEAVDGKGVPIIALASTTKKGDSKIIPTLKPGAGVVTSRAHVHYIITEHGIAYLFGKNMRQRAYELICIADPKHREALEKAAFERLKVMPSKD